MISSSSQASAVDRASGSNQWSNRTRSTAPRRALGAAPGPPARPQAANVRGKPRRPSAAVRKPNAWHLASRVHHVWVGVLLKGDHGDQIGWNFRETTGHRIDFSVFFVRVGMGPGDEVKVSPLSRCGAHAGTYIAKGEGELVLMFDNQFSWWTEKVVNFEVTRLRGDSGVDSADSTPKAGSSDGGGFIAAAGTPAAVAPEEAAAQTPPAAATAGATPGVEEEANPAAEATPGKAAAGSKASEAQDRWKVEAAETRLRWQQEAEGGQESDSESEAEEEDAAGDGRSYPTDWSGLCNALCEEFPDASRGDVIGAMGRNDHIGKLAAAELHIQYAFGSISRDAQLLELKALPTNNEKEESGEPLLDKPAVLALIEEGKMAEAGGELSAAVRLFVRALGGLEALGESRPKLRVRTEILRKQLESAGGPGEEQYQYAAQICFSSVLLPLHLALFKMRSSTLLHVGSLPKQMAVHKTPRSVLRSLQHSLVLHAAVPTVEVRRRGPVLRPNTVVAYEQPVRIVGPLYR